VNKTILIISSDHTGHGHKSITESICEKVGENSNINIQVVDGFSLGGKSLMKMGKMYAPITRHSEQLWEFIWKVSAKNSTIVDKFIEKMIHNNFLKVINNIKPDLILSVHPNFNGSVINILEKNQLNIPFVTLIADLVNIYPLWADKRADCIISPTTEAKEKCIEFGIPAEKIKEFGFPVRERFHRNVENDYKKDKQLNFLIMSGGEGVGNMKKIAENLLDNFDCKVRIVAGRNKKLKEKLENSLKSNYGEKVEIYGFTKNIQDLMLASDIAFTRGSPNVMFEAVAANLPIVITGALPGQEENNPDFAEKHNLGVICKDINQIEEIINELIENDGEKLKTIIDAQREIIQKDTSNNILNFLTKTKKEAISR
jgi:processive 1,2-diacylglycerol beta-glucosyltransferase